MASSLARLSVLRLPARALLPRVAVASQSRFFTIEGDMKLKESAEENKFIREREKALLDMKHAKEQAELEHKFAAEDRKGNLDAEAEFDAKVTLCVEELKGILGSNDTLSADTMLKIAKWKLVEE